MQTPASVRRARLKPVTIAAVGDLIDHGIRMHAECRGCRRGAWVDLEAVAGRIGREHSYLRGKLRLKCAACGSRDVASVIISASTAATK